MLTSPVGEVRQHIKNGGEVSGVGYARLEILRITCPAFSITCPLARIIVRVSMPESGRRVL